MAMTAYTGIQGSGKSYEVVRGVIVPNVAKGRRVVTNVAGLQIDKINAFCVEKLGANPDKLGAIVHIENDAVIEPEFFPREKTEKEWEQHCEKFAPLLVAGEVTETLQELWDNRFVVRGGDVIILDECWRWFVTGEVLRKEHLTFFRMHRHFTHPETGQCCDIVLIAQDIGDLQRKVLSTIEKSFLMQKHKDLGMPDWYVTGIYSGRSQSQKSLIESFNQKYDPEIFELYSSYSQSSAGAPKEDQADKRGNLFNRKILRFGIPIAIVMILSSFYFMWRFFHPEQKKPEKLDAETEQKTAAPVSHAKHSSEVSDTWRIVGSLTLGGDLVFVLADNAQRLRYIANPPGYKSGFSEIEVALPSGEIVTRWSGAAASNTPGSIPR